MPNVYKDAPAPRESRLAHPLLADRGGWGRANRTFDGQLAELLDQLNEELVAA